MFRVACCETYAQTRGMETGQWRVAGAVPRTMHRGVSVLHRRYKDVRSPVQGVLAIPPVHSSPGGFADEARAMWPFSSVLSAFAGTLDGRYSQNQIDDDPLYVFDPLVYDDEDGGRDLMSQYAPPNLFTEDLFQLAKGHPDYPNFR